jgi:predicted acylesterase/phospholipase RssA
MSGPRKTALVISGGGAKGAFAVGVLKHLFQEYRGKGWFGICGGTSTGALIAPMAALMGGGDPLASEAMETLQRLYTTVTTRDILEKRYILDWLARQDCLYESDPLNDLLHAHFPKEWFRWLKRKSAPDCYVVYTEYRAGQKVAASPKDHGMTRKRFLQAMRASASVPVVMEGIPIDDSICYDGGVRDLLPFSQAISLGAEAIVPIFLDPEEFPVARDPLERIDKILLRTLSILVDEAGRNDYEMASLVNIAVRARGEILDAFSADADSLRRIKSILDKEEFRPLFGVEKRLVHVIMGVRPDGPLTDDSLEFDPQQMAGWLAMGEEKAREVILQNPFVSAD